MSRFQVTLWKGEAKQSVAWTGFQDAAGRVLLCEEDAVVLDREDLALPVDVFLAGHQQAARSCPQALVLDCLEFCPACRTNGWRPYGGAVL